MPVDEMVKTAKPHPHPQAGDPVVRDAMDALRRIVRALRLAAGDVQRQAGISVAQLFVLQQLAEGSRSVNELATATATDPSTVSGVVRRLLDAGLVVRRPSPHDRRRAEISLTPEGAALLARAPAAPQEIIVAAIDALPERQRRAVASGLVAIADQLGAVPPTFFFED
jgi:DNA-binding MarR family transcriptional regulator